MGYDVILPSGDTTGNTDLENITSSLSETGYAYLAKGDYYVSNSILLKDGYSVKGVNCYLTKIHATTANPVFAQTSEISSIGLSLEDLQLVCDTENEVNAINIAGSITSPYTGCSFSLFKNIVSKGFSSGFFGNHFWNTIFENFRIMNGSSNGIYLGGGCNNIAIDMFSGNNLQSGIRITTSIGDTTENTNITINNADVEYCNRGVYAYGANHVGVNDIYSEHNSITIYARECKGFAVNGFYSSHDTKFGEIYCDVSIKDGAYLCSNSSDIGIIDIQDTTANVVTENIQAQNLLGGKVFILKNNMNNKTPINSESLTYTIETKSFRINYSSDKYTGTFQSYNEAQGTQFVCANPQLVCTSDKSLTVTSNDEISLYKNGTVIAKCDVLAGDILTAGKTYNFRNQTADTKTFTYKDGDEFEIRHSNTTGVDSYFSLRFTGALKGKFFVN